MCIIQRRDAILLSLMMHIQFYQRRDAILLFRWRRDAILQQMVHGSKLILLLYVHHTKERCYPSAFTRIVWCTYNNKIHLLSCTQILSDSSKQEQKEEERKIQKILCATTLTTFYSKVMTRRHHLIRVINATTSAFVGSPWVESVNDQLVTNILSMRGKTYTR
jgi:hypothetical protein